MNKKSKLVYGVGVNDADYQVPTKINYRNHRGVAHENKIQNTK